MFLVETAQQLFLNKLLHRNLKNYKTTMNRIIFTLLFSFLFLSSIAQTFQGTIKPGSTSASVICAIKPSANYSDKPSNLQLTIAIPQAVGARPAMTVTTNNYSIFFSTVALFQTATFGTDYIYLINMTVPTLTTVKNYTAGTEDEVAEVSFAGNVGNISDIRLVQLPNGMSTGGAGSENGNYNFYTEFATGSNKTNETAMFYSSTGGVVVNSPLGFGGYSSVSAGSVLPLTWLNFSAQKQNGNALVKWDVANQLNNDYFEVQVSNDGRSFATIGKVPATEKTSYSFTDANLYKLRSSYADYRIKQVDKDGKATYSEIRKLLITGKEFAFTVVGNPVTVGQLHIGIQSPENSKGVVTILDMNGKKVFMKNVAWPSGYSQQSLSIPFLAGGTYTANLTTASGQFQVKFVK